jgi:hypothetical protein
MKSLASIRSGAQPTIISERKKPQIPLLEEDELSSIDDTLGLSYMYLSDSIELLDGMYQTLSSYESVNEETRMLVASLYDAIKDASTMIQSSESIEAPTEE